MEATGKKGRRTKRLPAEEAAMVEGGDKLFRIIVAIIAEVVRLGGAGKFARLAQPTSQALVTELADLIIGQVAVPMVQVAWQAILPWIIAACRFTSFVNQDITAEHFPLQPGDLVVKVVETLGIPRVMSDAEVRKHIDDAGYRPATLVELLWWWLTHPAEQVNCLVVALGSGWDGLVPYVYGGGGSRSLSLLAVAGGFRADCSFAVVRQSLHKKLSRLLSWESLFLITKMTGEF